MASAADNRHRWHHHPAAHLSRLLHTASTNLSSILLPGGPQSSSKIHLPLLLPNSILSPSDAAQPDSTIPPSSPTSSIRSMPSSEPAAGFPPTLRISSPKGGGPAFVGQVFSMCDLSGTGLMAVTTHFDIPFLSERTPKWLKKMFAAATKSERNGPVFRFFMDLGDAVSYVKKLNIPSGVVGACGLDIAYEYFKDKPHLFQFVPNEKQVKEANKLLKTLPHNDGKKKVEGVPVFSAQNLDIAIATKHGIKWYTPYFFDKNMLDNILEESADQHFYSLIETRNFHRRRDVTDDNLTSEIVEEMGDSMWDPPEVQEVLDEIGHPGIPLSVISKAAEIQLLYAVDKVLLGNRWLRKVTGIQPRFPYMIDSFERKSAASLLRAKNPSRVTSNTEPGVDDHTLEMEMKDDKPRRALNFQFPFGDWSSHPWAKQQEDEKNLLDTRQHTRQEVLLPKITMVGISTGESGKMNKANLKKMMDDLTRQLEQPEQVSKGNQDERDPLFVAYVGDYYSALSKSPWLPGGSL